LTARNFAAMGFFFSRHQLSSAGPYTGGEVRRVAELIRARHGHFDATKDEGKRGDIAESNRTRTGMRLNTAMAVSALQGHSAGRSYFSRYRQVNLSRMVLGRETSEHDAGGGVSDPPIHARATRTMRAKAGRFSPTEIWPADVSLLQQYWSM